MYIVYIQYKLKIYLYTKKCIVLVKFFVNIINDYGQYIQYSNLSLIYAHCVHRKNA